MKGSTTILRCAVFVAGAAVLAMCGGVTWEAVAESHVPPGYPFFPYFMLAVVCACAAPFFVALYQAHKLLGYIDTNRAFSELSVRALRIITHCAVVVFAVCVVGGLPFFYILSQIEDAPGVMIVGLAIAGGAFVIAMFASVLNRLLREAIAVKSENDLTI
jgi:hypothetical protein